MGALRASTGSILALAFWMCAAAPGAAAERLVLATPENTIDTVIGEVIVREAYRRLGYEVEIRKYPGERAVRLADRGEVDGEVQLIDGIAEKYPNLIQVRPAINFIEATAFSKTVDITVDGWESLSPYRIGIIRGIKFAERYTEGMSVAPAGSYEVLFRLLDKGRVDVAVSPNVNGWYRLKQMGIERIHALEPRIAVFDLYHYLNRKHADLVPYIGAMFARMRASGELPRLRARVVAVMMKRAEQNLGPCDDDYACFEIPETEN